MPGGALKLKGSAGITKHKKRSKPLKPAEHTEASSSRDNGTAAGHRLVDTSSEAAGLGPNTGTERTAVGAGRKGDTTANAQMDERGDAHAGGESEAGAEPDTDANNQKSARPSQDAGAKASESAFGDAIAEDVTSPTSNPSNPSHPTSGPTPLPPNRTKTKTNAELKHEAMRRKQLAAKVARGDGGKTHKQRVEELNKYLSGLSEHHDMPRIGPG